MSIFCVTLSLTTQFQSFQSGHCACMPAGAVVAAAGPARARIYKYIGRARPPARQPRRGGECVRVRVPTPRACTATVRAVLVERSMLLAVALLLSSRYAAAAGAARLEVFVDPVGGDDSRLGTERSSALRSVHMAVRPRTRPFRSSVTR